MQKWPWLLLGMMLLQPLPAVSENVIKPDPQWKVARAQFTTQISEREPVDQVLVTRPPVSELYFFTDLRHLEGRTITHRWEFEGQLISVVPFKVAGPRWRVFSRKEIEPEQIGEWSVTVLDESGWPLHTELFHYEAAASRGEQVPPDEVPAAEPQRMEPPAVETPAAEVPATEVPATEVPATEVQEPLTGSGASGVDTPVLE